MPLSALLLLGVDLAHETPHNLDLVQGNPMVEIQLRVLGKFDGHGLEKCDSD